MAQSEVAADPELHRILVIDDDPETAELVRAHLGGRPFQVLEAGDGGTGLRVAGRERIDVILLDLTMPGLDGIAVARRLKEDPRNRSVPIILLTACRDLDSKVEAFSAGADDYVTKPFDLEELEARIQASLRNREIMRGMESQIRDLQTTTVELEQLLMLDEKTGLYNFRAFQRRIREEWERADRYQIPLSLVLLDVDHFKRINDTLGHPAGDRVLHEFATLVAGGARANDIAARYGGEEFAVILPHTDAAMADRVAERIRRAVEDFVFLADASPVRVTVSAGVATFPSRPEITEVDGLIRVADRALYAAKERGRNRVVQASEL